MTLKDTNTRKLARYFVLLTLLIVVLSALWIYIIAPAMAASSIPPTIQTDHLLQTTVQTADRQFLLTLTIKPKGVGMNTFVASVVEAGSRRARTDVVIVFSVSNVDMDMGTATMYLEPDGAGNFNAQHELTMAGRWHIHAEIQTQQNALHQADISFQIAS